MIVVVSHDAGGAEILSSWVLSHNEKYHLIADGPARDIFERKVGKCERKSLESAIMDSDWLLVGTSFNSNLEIDAINLARDNGIKSIAFLDHWCNYIERFKRKGKMYLPDEIWVGDEAAYEIANKEFPSVPVLLKSNPYFESLKVEFNKLKQQQQIISRVPSVLYVCSPLNEVALRNYGDERYWGYTDEEAIKYFLNNLDAFNCKEIKIVIRPHPTEKVEKYDWVLEEFSLEITISKSKTLLQEIVDVDLIVGCNSMAMVVGLIAGKRVISGLPPGHRTYCLPMQNIEHLHDIIEKYNS